ncbi:MAG: hypothetical protein D6741_19085 [Planctomycetota bacterium]|nr:MAG: hypothetical protein D6741_19085 [Planctomycetota bacterium]
MALVIFGGTLFAESGFAETTGPQPVRLSAIDFGAACDGKTDDGPALARLVEAVSQRRGRVTVVFPESATIRVETAPDRYVFRFDGVSDLTIDGRGTTFVLGPNVRFLRLARSKNVVLENLNVDFDPLPAVEGTIVDVAPAAHAVDVRLDPAFRNGPSLSEGPTHQDGEQTFFGMLWYPGKYGPVSRHYWIENMIPDAHAPGRVRAIADASFDRFDDIVPGEWRISLPVPGIAHRFGPGACFEIWDDENVTLERVELWSAPWFGFRVFRNSGKVTFKRVNIRPKPGTRRITSTWRDGFHVKGNAAELLWEDCIVAGTNDDAFNLSYHSSRVVRIDRPDRIVVRQIYPLNFMPWHVGDEVVFADPETNVRTASAVLRAVEPSLVPSPWDRTRAQPTTLVFDRPVDVSPGHIAWQPSHANPHTTLRRCRIENSCRIQTSTTLEECDVTAFLWFYREGIEGPGPAFVRLRDCTLRRGRGNPQLAVSILGRTPHADGPSIVERVELVGNRIYGRFLARGVDTLVMRNNAFIEADTPPLIEDVSCLVNETTPEDAAP